MNLPQLYNYGPKEELGLQHLPLRTFGLNSCPFQGCSRFPFQPFFHCFCRLFSHFILPEVVDCGSQVNVGVG